ncbi:MAG: 50S ribosomal protein L29 [Spirochaetes bacterium]|nr:50S ribosomal protein L29 [Spirochaetota bacterium]
MAKAEKKKASNKVNFSELTDAELNRHHTDFRKELQEIRFSMVTASYPNNARVGLLKRDIARILTVQNQRKNAVQTTGGKA